MRSRVTLGVLPALLTAIFFATACESPTEEGGPALRVEVVNNLSPAAAAAVYLEGNHGRTLLGTVGANTTAVLKAPLPPAGSHRLAAESAGRRVVSGVTVIMDEARFRWDLQNNQIVPLAPY